MSFILSALWRWSIRSLWKLPHGRDWLRGKLGLILMSGAVFSKSLIQSSVDWWGYVTSLLLDLRPNYGGGSEDNSNLLQKVPCMHCFASNPEAGHCQPTPLPETPGHSWACLGQFFVGSLFVSPGSWCIQAFVYSKSLFPWSCVSCCGSMVGLLATSSKRAYAIPRSVASRAPAAGHCWPVPPQETLRHSSGSVSVGWVNASLFSKWCCKN